MTAHGTGAYGAHDTPGGTGADAVASGAPRRIAIIGYSGGGKSTLARALGESLGLPVLHLDAVQFLPGWRTRPVGEQRSMVAEFLERHDAWVIDGNYSDLCERERLASADLIVMLLFNRFARLWRVCKRLHAYRGRSRPSMAAGCEERLDAEFVWWVLHQGCDASHRNRYRAIRHRHASKTVVIRNQRQLTRFTQGLCRQQLRTAAPAAAAASRS
ncbi:DNA topology modulation protein FlaR [Bifidobacterium scardovii]|uniref:Topology modulation protein n=1 Tax=Bifidobacterium scardovii TaxID=158787 RepID=A0A087DHT4_9BIFI|nr:DNA topology modulation protein FlaR [Bifidobacterium scardovii]KFI95084.1 topology modulation protein [Bifidobacterium scardovii]MBS6948867.1 hypothetical protein [Bifidobacterium scardovii]MDK6348836.1 hypothetical protein [Bifidobacterium scardovii]MDU2422268.1 hypothetical protein [Bifidobacterium scardovii]MDU3736130.1 hypothetical protein [Bifidobacterium scardovii]